MNVVHSSFIFSAFELLVSDVYFIFDSFLEPVSMCGIIVTQPILMFHI